MFSNYFKIAWRNSEKWVKVSGTYPAFYLSKFNLVKILKGTFRVGRFQTLPRKTLVVVQFTVSIVLSIAAIVIIRQIHYGTKRPAGYTREGLISVAVNNRELVNRYSALRDDLSKTGFVQDMAESSSPLTAVCSNLVRHPMDAVKEQSANVYATNMAKRGISVQQLLFNGWLRSEE